MKRLRTAPPSVPVGWKLVPVEPTEAMQDAHRMYGDTSDWWNAMLAAAPALAQQPAACPKCEGTGEADSGGVMPWGAPAMILCECQQPAAVDGAAVDRVAAALLEEATDEPWTVAGVEHEGPDRDYYRKLARKVLALAAQPGGAA